MAIFKATLSFWNFHLHDQCTCRAQSRHQDCHVGCHSGVMRIACFPKSPPPPHATSICGEIVLVLRLCKKASLHTAAHVTTMVVFSSFPPSSWTQRIGWSLAYHLGRWSSIQGYCIAAKRPQKKTTFPLVLKCTYFDFRKPFSGFRQVN